MFPDTDLPLALVMEEILGWEKKPDNKTADEEKGRYQRQKIEAVRVTPSPPRLVLKIPSQP